MTATIRPGVSEAAEILKRVQNDAWKSQDETVTFSSHPLDDQLIDVYCHCSQDNWEGDDSVAVDRETLIIARDLIESLPRAYRTPTISGEPDGHVNLEWYVSPRRILSVSVKKEDQMSLATKLAASAGSRLEPPAQS